MAEVFEAVEADVFCVFVAATVSVVYVLLVSAGVAETGATGVTVAAETGAVAVVAAGETETGFDFKVLRSMVVVVPVP